LRWKNGRFSHSHKPPIKEKFPDHAVTAVGTNSAAAAAMLKAGADNAATGMVLLVCKKQKRRRTHKRCASVIDLKDYPMSVVLPEKDQTG
jgi:hypothetical protein